MNTRELIAVTGMGLVTSLGNTLEETWQGMMHGRSGVKTISRFSPKELPTSLLRMLIPLIRQRRCLMNERCT